MICKKRGCLVSVENELELHHLVPKFMGGTDKEGRRWLCKKHHYIITNITPKLILEFVHPDRKEGIKKRVKDFTLWWLKQT